MLTKKIPLFIGLFVAAFFVINAKPAEALILFQQTDKNNYDSITLFNRTDCTTSDGAKCRFQLFQNPGGVVYRSVEYAFGTQGGIATAKACLYSMPGVGAPNFGSMTQRACSTIDSVANTYHTQKFDFITPYVAASAERMAVSIEIQTGGDLLIMGTKSTALSQGCYLQGSAPPVSCSLRNLYFVVRTDENVVEPTISNPFSGQGELDFENYIYSYPSHDAVMGACVNTDVSDYIACAFSYIQYWIIPDGDSLYNVVAAPIGVLMQKWPFAYISTPINAWIDGLDEQSTTCVLPDSPTQTLFGTSIPVFSICDTVDDLDLDSKLDTFGEDIIIFLLYISFGFLWFGMAKRFLRG